MKQILFILLLTCATATAVAQRADYRVIPLPKSVETDTAQVFTLRSGMGIAYDASNPEIARNVQFLCQWVEELTGVKLALTHDDKTAAIRLTLGLDADKKAKKTKKAKKGQHHQGRHSDSGPPTHRLLPCCPNPAQESASHGEVEK